MTEVSIRNSMSRVARYCGPNAEFVRWLRRLVAPTCFTVLLSALLISPTQAKTDFTEAARALENGEFERAAVLLEDLVAVEFQGQYTYFLIRGG